MKSEQSEMFDIHETLFLKIVGQYYSNGYMYLICKLILSTHISG